MDQEKIGKFIAKCRKAKKITQSELAEQLGVTNRSVSNWENGKNMPDLSLFKPLCEILEITINELLSGEKLKKEEYQEKFEENFISVLSNVNEKNTKLKKILILLPLIFILIITLLTLFINNKVILNYNKDKMYIEENDNSLVFTNKDTCTIYSGNIKEYSTTYKNDLGIIFLSSKCSYKEMIKQSIDNANNYRRYHINLAKNFPKKIKIYYTNLEIKNIENASKKDIDKLIDKSILIFEK